MVWDGIERRRMKRLSAPRISTMVFLLAGALIVLSASALLFIGFVATHAANRQAAHNGSRMFENALQERLALMARDQLTLARWDRTVANVVLAFDKAYVQKEMVDSLWYDYGHDRTFVIDPDGRLLAEAVHDEVHFDSNSPVGTDLRTIAAQARALHFANRLTIAGGFGQKSVPGQHIDRIAALGYARIDGIPALVSAMAIVPDDGTVALPEGPPVVLISAKYIDAELLSDLSGQLAFPNLTFQGPELQRRVAHHFVTAADGARIGAFVWDARPPGSHIWTIVIPVITVISGILAIAAFMLARQIARLSSRLEESERRSRHLARHDPLTGLANRLEFDAALAAALAPRTPFTVIACDLDRFKAVNDTHGHAAGDSVLCVVAERLRETLGSAGLVARTGGDEFIMLITGYTDRPRLTVLSHQIIATINEPIILDNDVTTDIGISLGIAVAPAGGTSETRIQAEADAALYDAKRRGRGCAVFAGDEATIGEEKSGDEAGGATDPEAADNQRVSGMHIA
ncbi:diguanylate cyclase [Breoghania sp. L-A4]|uniref:diguanylate cyclase domain-containing protein n=1 Tax=Breoghania sp. L-A4 TaxID=2304600 RepID=UPI000E35BEF0|nr:diguanylate cyclase [Breoghania sp. L-A4]AXS40848.1 diguanylate cyclase [Breoghania sp. L-A4]